MDVGAVSAGTEGRDQAPPQQAPSQQAPLQQQVETTLVVKKKKTRITNEQKAVCFRYFEDKQFNRNTKLGTGGGPGESLKTFMEEYGITRNQVKTQL